MMIAKGRLWLTSVPPSLCIAGKRPQLLVNAKDASNTRWRLVMTGPAAKSVYEQIKDRQENAEITVAGALARPMCLNGALFMFAPVQSICVVPHEQNAVFGVDKHGD